MNDIARAMLCKLIAEYGHSLCHEPRRLEALLRDYCGAHSAEISTLMIATRERVAEDLMSSPSGVPRRVLFARLANRLQDERALTEEAAVWAVNSWALALRVITPEMAADTREPERRKMSTVTLASGVEMVFQEVPRGTFLMGSDPVKDPDAEDSERPQRQVYLDAYWIGKYPVTNAEYAAFVAATGHRVPEHWLYGQPPKGKEVHPVVYVSWEDATAFCVWASQIGGRAVRLLTEAEWEKAAGGTDGRLYPWGDEKPDRNRCNFNLNEKGTTTVGHYSAQGDSPYGCADMAGNVWERCSDWCAAETYRNGSDRNPTGPEDGILRVMRGGSWYYNWFFLRVACRHCSSPRGSADHVGFRCAAGAPGN